MTTIIKKKDIDSPKILNIFKLKQSGATTDIIEREEGKRQKKNKKG